MSGIPRKYKGLNIQFDLDDVKRAFIHNGMMGESISFKQKNEEDEEVVVFGSKWALDNWLKKMDNKITKILEDAEKTKKSAESKQAKADRDYETANARAEQEWKDKFENWQSVYKLKCDQEVRQAQSDRDAAIEEMEKTKKQNENLMRIQRERANAKRGITPKGKRSGYVLIDTGHATYKYTYTEPRTYVYRGNVKETDEMIEKVGSYECYKSTFETPINALIDEDTAFETIYDNWKNCIWGDSGDTRWVNFSNKGNIKEAEYQRIFDWSLKPDMKSGLWKITIWHNKALEPITENLQTVSA